MTTTEILKALRYIRDAKKSLNEAADAIRATAYRRAVLRLEDAQRSAAASVVEIGQEGKAP